MNNQRATLNDVDILVELRKKQLVDEGIDPNQEIDEELYQFFHEKISDDSLVQWLLQIEGEIVACGAIIFYDFPPTYTNKSGKKAYITNMYTKEEYRGRGIATEMLEQLVNEARRRGVTKVWLGASKLGRPVYKKFGFQETDEWLELTV